MAKQILTFEEFIKRILKLIFWVLLLTPLIIVPVYYAFASVLGLNLDIFALTAKPDQLIAFVFQMLSTEPFRSLFAWTVFPGFTWVALYSTIFMGWVERKLTAKIQLRTGPMYAGRFEGILQNFADFFKLLFKEIVIPETADKATFVAVPFALMAVAGALVALLPLSPTTYIANPPVGPFLSLQFLDLHQLSFFWQAGQATVSIHF